MSHPFTTGGSDFRKRRLSLPSTCIDTSDKLRACLEDLSESETEQASEMEWISSDMGNAKKVKKGGEKSVLISKSTEARDIGYNLSDDERFNLAFPERVVGMYSCPGLEPMYGASNTEVDEEKEGQNNGGGGTKCVAKINQDRGAVAYPYGATPKCALFAAFDGHGEKGDKVAQFAISEIRGLLEKHKEFNSNIAQAFHDVFLTVDQALGNKTDIEAVFSGTTACVALLRSNEVIVANVGDSRCVLGRKNSLGQSISIDLSKDQNPDSPSEQERIEKSGGFVSPPPEEGLSARVWLDKDMTQIGLAMSRSIGDHAVKEVGVIAEPVVTRHTLLSADEFLIIATDGVWEFISSDQAVKLVSDCFATGVDASAACEALIERAAALWHEYEGDYRDDITALVVRLNQLWL